MKATIRLLPPRPIEDQAAARELLATGREDQEWNYAIQLLDASNLSEWQQVLDTDHFIRRDALARMRQMKDPDIGELLRRDAHAFEDFVENVTKSARSAGLRVGKRSGDALQIEDHWIGVDTFFYRRRIQNALPRIIDWIKDLNAGRDPHDRSDHFFVD